jgi:hypothetical protein
MSGRNRNRNNANQDADEERRLWEGIKMKAKEVDDMVVRPRTPTQDMRIPLITVLGSLERDRTRIDSGGSTASSVGGVWPTPICQP